MTAKTRRALVPIVLLAFVPACGLLSSSGGEEETPERRTGPDVEPASPVLLSAEGALGEGDPSDNRGPHDRHFVQVGAQERIAITLTSEAFDPVLEVTPPGSGALVNDDYEGNRQRSYIELITPAAGAMRVEVRAYGQGEGAYAVRVERLPKAGSDADEASAVALLGAGDHTDGVIDDGDPTLEDGTHFDAYLIRIGSSASITVARPAPPAPEPGGLPPENAEPEEPAAPPVTTMVGPAGLSMQATSPGRYEAHVPGTYRLQVHGAPGDAYRVDVAAEQLAQAPLFERAHHSFAQMFNQLQGTALTGGSAAPSAPTGGGPIAAEPTANPGLPGTVTAGANPAPAPLPVRLGDRLQGNLAENDARLASGEYYDVYQLQLTATQPQVSISMESGPVDTFLRVDGPNGQHWENDDAGGSLNSEVVLTRAAAGTYRIVATSYRPGATGPYELKVLTPRAGATAGGGAPSGGSVVTGELERGDSTLQSGEFADTHSYSWPVGARVHLEARSSAFDTYLLVRAGGQSVAENDDMNPPQTNAGLDFQVTQAGPHEIVVTSYRPGETGAYQLLIQGAAGTPTGQEPSAGNTPPATNPAANPPATPPADASMNERGTLAEGDTQLQTGEFVDEYEMTFPPRSAVTVRLTSSDFDPYLIVHSPSGNQEDNDDLEPGNLNSGIDIPVAEPGTYRILVTSYRAGEAGAYQLSVRSGESVVAPPPPTPNGPNGPNANPNQPQEGRVWGLFAGITDYPGGVNDLPECANDARKLAEAVRNQGVMPADQEFLLTDAEVTTGRVRQIMREVASQIRPDDVFVFFYSGHGGQTRGTNDEDELDQRDEYLVLHDGQLLDDELGQMFDNIRARVALVAIDACFAGGFAKDVIDRRGIVGMFSSEEDVTSAVAGRFQAGGYLSHFLRLGIGGEADNDPSNSILTVGELSHYTWRQFGQHAADVRMSMGYQHLVVDRGAVPTNEVLWAAR